MLSFPPGQKSTNPDLSISKKERPHTNTQGCFAMVLPLILNRAGLTPDYVDATAHVTVAPENGGFRITKSHLVCEARVRGMDQAAFGQHAETARANCTISRALAHIEVTLQARLIGR